MNHPQRACRPAAVCPIPRSHTTGAAQAGNVDAEGARPLPVPSGKAPKVVDESADEPVMGIPDSPGAVPYAQYRNLRLMNMRGMLLAGASLLEDGSGCVLVSCMLGSIPRLRISRSSVAIKPIWHAPGVQHAGAGVCGK